MPKIEYCEVVSNIRSDYGRYEVVARFTNDSDARIFIRRHNDKMLRVVSAEIDIYDSMRDYDECRLRDLKKSALEKLSVEEQEALGLLEVKATQERKIGPELISRLKGFVEGIQTGDIEIPNGPPIGIFKNQEQFSGITSPQPPVSVSETGKEQSLKTVRVVLEVTYDPQTQGHPENWEWSTMVLDPGESVSVVRGLQDCVSWILHCLTCSTPMEVVRPALNQASSPQYVDIVQHRDAEWLAALAAVGQTIRGQQ